MRHIQHLFSLAVLLLALASSPAGEEPVRAGELFSGAKGWLGTAEPLTNDKLKGQVVLVDFWTYCCINCMHVIPDLKFLEEKYKDQPFVVIGVHSGKFDHEKDIANIRAAVLRNGIHHPVAVDSDFAIWNRFGVRSWPTLVLIGSDGKPVGAISGEGHRELLDKVIAKTLAEGRANGTLAAKPLVFTPEVDVTATGPLSFPGKIIADAARKRLFIADTGHNRILITGLDGAVTTVIGSGKAGLTDGAIAEAQFNEPQGMAVTDDGKLLYVCDRLNHALRVVDLAAGSVRTLCGNGEQGSDRQFRGPAAKALLNSPWDCLVVGTRLFIAMAGPHQIWSYDLATNEVGVFAGSGRESCVNGPHLMATFAQPSGLASDGQRLYVADSETSSIRAVDLDPAGETRTIAGSEDLFGFGLVDGLGRDARFQHPIGITLTGPPGHTRLIVTDTYNHVLRSVDPLTGEVKTIAGTGKAERGTPEKIGFFEPHGVAALGDALYVADTNQHRIVVVEGGKARELAVTLPKP